MRGTKLYLIAFAILLTNSRISAQTYTTGHEDKKADVNLTELAEYYRLHPLPVVRQEPIDEGDEEEKQPEHPAVTDPSLIHMLHRSAAKEIVPGLGTDYLPVSYSPVDTFLALTTNGSYIPPDTHGDVDTTYCVTATNMSVLIQNRTTHGTVLNAALNTFWSSVLPSGTSPFDPRVHYDPYNKRWIIVTFAVNQSTMKSSNIMIGVSATSSPTGTWHMYTVAVDATGKSWLDFPNVGFNKQWVAVTGNFFQNSSGGQTGGVWYVFDYAQIIAGTGAPYTKISKSSSFSICPALTYDANTPNMFGLEAWNGAAGQLRLWKLTGTASTPVLTSIGYPTSTIAWSSNFSSDAGPQSGTANKIDCGDNRITRAVYINGKIWCAYNAFFSSPSRCSIMWWQIDTTGNPLQVGLINDPTGVNFYVYPSIAVNQNDDAFIGFSNLSSNSHPNAGYALHMHTDPKDSMRPPFIYRHGKSTYYQTFGGSKNRWGDYSAGCVDPKNMTDFWTIQESTPTTANAWDTWWAHVTVCAANASYSVVKHAAKININDTFTFTGTSPTGTTYSWNFGSGATPATSTSAGPIAVKWTTTGTKTITLTVTVGTCSTSYTDTVNISIQTGISQLHSQYQALKIVPNPSKGVFDIVFDNPVTGPVTIKLTDIQGREVYNKQFTAANDTKLSVITDRLPAGIYIANVYTEGDVVTEKVTIE